VHLVLLIERLAVQGGAAVAPPGEKHERLRPIVVAAPRIGAVLVKVGDDAAVLARVELVKSIDRQEQVTLGDLQARFEPAGVFDLVHVDLDGACHRLCGRA
jgi:hypothetical protein